MATSDGDDLLASAYAPYSGVPTYGPITRTPVNVLGASHFEMRDGKVLRECRLVDEIAVLAQIHAGRVAMGAGV